MKDPDLILNETENVITEEASETEPVKTAEISDTKSTLSAKSSTDIDEEAEEETNEEYKKFIFMKAAQGYGMIIGFGVGYILSGVLCQLGFQAGKFECVIICMFAGMAIGYFLPSRKNKK